MVGVACILVSGITMSLFYIGSWEGFYGTAFGVMVGAKIAMFLMLLALGGVNFLLVERLRADPRPRSTGCGASPRRRSASASRCFSPPPR